jgi:hypothetical protein
MCMYLYLTLEHIYVINITQITRHQLFLFTIFIINVGGSTYGELRVIKIQNLFPHHVSLHYDDSEAGTFLTIIGSNEISKVKASSGMYYHTYKLTTRFRFLSASFLFIFKLIDQKILMKYIVNMW